jgi:uncharacterized PurR-regulated membrane protein YhhQ (DUF165 family)
MKRSLGITLLILYIGTIFMANWALVRYGIVPIGFGLTAPAGVFFAGLAFGLRDGVQDALGRWWTILAILIGALLSVFVSRQFALASGIAFLLSETADMAVYTPLRERHWIGAVVVSNLVGDAVDSFIFLYLAFGSVAYWEGQIVGKWAMTVPVIALLGFLRWRRRERLYLAIDPAGGEVGPVIIR